MIMHQLASSEYNCHQTDHVSFPNFFPRQQQQYTDELLFFWLPSCTFNPDIMVLSPTLASAKFIHAIHQI